MSDTLTPVYTSYQTDYNVGKTPTKGNGYGEEGFNNYQERVGNLTTLWGGKKVPADDHSQDRIDANGNIYSWDANAAGGGAWGVSGHLKDKSKAGSPNITVDDIQWNTREQYAQESGLDYSPGGKSAYNIDADPNAWRGVNPGTWNI